MLCAFLAPRDKNLFHRELFDVQEKTDMATHYKRIKYCTPYNYNNCQKADNSFYKPEVVSILCFKF